MMSMMKNRSIVGISLALIAVVLWGTAGTAQSFTKGAVSPFWIGALRLVFACIFFHALYLYSKYRVRKSTPLTSQGLQKIPPKGWTYWRCIIIAGICMGLYNLTFFTGISITGVAIGTATTIGSAPIWAGLLQAISTKQAPPKLWWFGTLCATVGGTWMVLTQTSSWHVNPIGLMVCLGAGFCYALYTLTSKQLVSMASPLTITTHTFSISALIAISAAFILAGVPSITTTSWLVILYLALFTTGIAYLLYTRALKYISAATGVALALVEPITAFFLAIFIVKEPINLLSVIGLCLILVGLVFVLRAEMQQNVKQ